MVRRHVPRKLFRARRVGIARKAAKIAHDDLRAAPLRIRKCTPHSLMQKCPDGRFRPPRKKRRRLRRRDLSHPLFPPYQKLNSFSQSNSSDASRLRGQCAHHAGTAGASTRSMLGV